MPKVQWVNMYSNFIIKMLIDDKIFLKKNSTVNQWWRLNLKFVENTRLKLYN